MIQNFKLNFLIQKFEKKNIFFLKKFRIFQIFCIKNGGDEDTIKMQKIAKSVASNSQGTKKIFKKAVFIFRRDLRIDDNSGLIYALQNAEKVYPCFIFDPRQILKARNDYFSNSCVQFMIESLEDLDGALKKKDSQLNYLYGEYPDIIEDLIKATQADLICVNEDFTKFSQMRDKQIEDSCRKMKCEFKSFEDLTLITKEEAMTGREHGQFHKKYSPFYRAVQHIHVREPAQCKKGNFAEDRIEIEGKIIEDGGKSFYDHNDLAELKGGRKEGLKILSNFKRLKNYKEIRNSNVKHKGGSMLSPYNKFGCVSIREVYYTAKFKLKDKAEAYIKQLFWREFMYFVAYYYPHVWQGPLKLEYNNIKWWTDKELFEAWKEGRTGCPIVDAGMRHMNATGWMTNRNRLITSNYLIKDLHLNWTWGEKYFSQKLVDYDPCQNNGGWQWSAGCGVDTQPYIRVFNPRIQSFKFDPQCKYIKKWVPELKDVLTADIHNWEKEHKKYVGKDGFDYPAPYVYHEEEKERTIKMYLDALGFKSEKEMAGHNKNFNRDNHYKHNDNNSRKRQGGGKRKNRRRRNV